jgi:DNA-binding MarR family transcriptional regulator
MVTPAREQAAVEALMVASRAFVGLAARSLADLDADVTLPQFRMLVVLASRGPQRSVDISNELGVAASTGQRMCDRLVRKGLVQRSRSASDRRAVKLWLSVAGRDLVEQILDRRRAELSRIVASTPTLWEPQVTEALAAFAAATGEVPEQEWWLGFAD